jgi:xanthine dehydrogenase accessory factor
LGKSKVIEFWQAANELIESGTAFTVVTMIACRGHVPQDVGAKAIITSTGLHQGTVGGGKVEARAIEHAQALLFERSNKGFKERQPQVLTWNLTSDIGMTCGGEVTFLFEVHDSKCRRIALFGAGHVAQALVRTLANLDFHVTCFDSRADWIERLPKSRKLTTVLASDLPAQVAALSANYFFIVMTQGHATDLPILRRIFELHPDAFYVGVMGSDLKAKKIRHDLLENGIGSGLVQKLRSPIGLPIGGNRPYEIAISVVAELLQEKDESRVVNEVSYD